MKEVIFLSLACLSMTGLSANGYGGPSYYETRSLANQERALQNQERQLSQQNQHPGSRVPVGGTTRIGR